MAATCLALGSSMARAGTPAVDSQFWGELDATHAISAALSATAIATLRVGRELPNPTLTAGGVQLDYRIASSWIVSGTGYFVAIRNAQSAVRTEVWLPAAALTYGTDVGYLALSDRNRVEQLEGLPGSPTRYRNRASAYWHIAGGNELSDIFITDEVFYDFSKDRWTRNRLQAGFQFRFRADTKLLAFYMRQNNDYGAPDRLDVLGLTLQLDIG
jgi:hypothetical protein